MDRAGYDPGAMVDFFERTQSAKPRSTGAFRSPVRVPASTRAAADTLRHTHAGYIVTTSEFIGIEQHLAALTAPAPPPQETPSLFSGRGAVTAVAHEVKVLQDPAVEEYVARIAGKLSQAGDLKVPLKVKVIAESSPRAVTLPEGVVYIATGMILAATSEAELAGAITHQIGHLAQSQDWLAGSNGLCLRVSAALAVPLDQLSGQSDAEARADLLGLEYMDRAGYDPGALADLYTRILQQMGNVSGVFAPWLSFPQSTRTSADALRNNRTYVIDTAEFRGIRERVATLAQ
jgi:beta-barrel assembly-enhancing protease